MLEKEIKFETAEDKKNFCYQASTINENVPIDLKCGSYTCDAASMLGVISIPINGRVIAKFNTDDVELINRKFGKWIKE